MQFKPPTQEPFQLNLSNIKIITEALGGKLKIHCNEKKAKDGTTFIAAIPVKVLVEN